MVWLVAPVWPTTAPVTKIPLWMFLARPMISTYHACWWRTRDYTQLPCRLGKTSHDAWWFSILKLVWMTSLRINKDVFVYKQEAGQALYRRSCACATNSTCHTCCLSYDHMLSLHNGHNPHRYHRYDDHKVDSSTMRHPEIHGPKLTQVYSILLQKCILIQYNQKSTAYTQSKTQMVGMLFESANKFPSSHCSSLNRRQQRKDCSNHTFFSMFHGRSHN